MAYFIGTVLVVTSSASADEIADFYRGKSIEITVAGTAAGGYDVAARTLATHMSRPHSR